MTELPFITVDLRVSERVENGCVKLNYECYLVQEPFKNNIFIPEVHLGLTWQDNYWKGRQSESIPLVILSYKDNKAPEGLDT